MNVCETFASFCGEVNVGRFAFFIRLGGCNLNCNWCDTPYKTEYLEMSIQDLVNQAEHFPRVVITGGEPLLQKQEVMKFIEKLKKRSPKILKPGIFLNILQKNGFEFFLGFRSLAKKCLAQQS